MDMSEAMSQVNRLNAKLGLANTSQFALSINGDSNYIVESVDGKGFEIDNLQYRISVTIICQFELDGQSLLSALATLTLIQGAQRFPLAARVESIASLGRSSDQKYAKYKLILVEPHHRFCTERHSRVFIGKSAVDIAQGLINQGLELCKSITTVVQEAPVHDMTVQYLEPDWHFIRRILAKDGYFLSIEHTADGIACAIVEDTTNLPQSEVIVKLPYYSSRGAAVDEVYAQSVTAFHQQRVAQVSLNDFNEHTGQRISIESKQINSEEPIDFRWGENTTDDHLGRLRANTYAQSQKAFASYIEIVTNAHSVRPGMKVQLSNHSDCSGDYLVTAVAFSGAQIGAAENAQGEYQSFTSTVTAIPVSTPFKPFYKKPAPVSATLTAKVTSDIDRDGHYQIRFPFDQTESAQSSKAVSQLQSFGGLDHGMAFPLVPDTDVVVSFINGDIDRPVILGALFSQSNPSPVTQDNPMENIIRTRSGSELVFHDTPNAESIALATPEHNNKLLLNAEQEAHVAELSSEHGEIRLSAGTNIEVESGADYQLTVGGDSNTEVAGSASFMTETGQIDIQSNDQLNMLSKGDLNLQSSENDISIIAGGECFIQSETGFQQQVDSGDATIRVEEGSIQLEAGSNIEMMAGGSITLSQGDGSIHIDASGNLTLQGPSVDIVADKITMKSGSISQN